MNVVASTRDHGRGFYLRIHLHRRLSATNAIVATPSRFAALNTSLVES